MAKQTSDATFAHDVLESDVPVLVDFWAPWCGPCRMVGPLIEQVAKVTRGKAEVYKLNVDENPMTAGRYGITAIPTVMVFRGGRAVKELIGVQPAEAYVDAVAA
jgi:thioredoxin 1